MCWLAAWKCVGTFMGGKWANESFLYLQRFGGVCPSVVLQQHGLHSPLHEQASPCLLLPAKSLSGEWGGHEKSPQSGPRCVTCILAIIEFYVYIMSSGLTKYGVWKSILIMKANKMHYFSDLFDKVFYVFQACPLSIIRSISMLYTQR